MKKLALFFIAAGAFLFAGKAFAQQTVQKYITETRYLLYLPDGYDENPAESWPLVVFLHGAGEVGDDIEKIKVHGLPKLVEQGMKFPFVGISPQMEVYGWQPKTVSGLINDAISKYNVDTDRIYLTGISMGGFGTWATAQEYPELFAAIVPVCGGGDPTKAHTLKNIAVWNFHGDADDIVSIEWSDKIVEAVREYNPSVKYTAYPGVNHDSWTQTYENPEVWEWMLGQKKFRYEEVRLEREELERYAGDYYFEGYPEMSASVTVEGNGIVFSNGDHREVNYPAGDDIFFRDPGAFYHIRFDRGSDGTVTGGIIFNPGYVIRIIRKY